MADFGSYILYLSVFAVSIFGSWRYGRTDTKRTPVHIRFVYALMTVLPVMLLQGLRYNVGTDYQSYVSLVEGFSQGNGAYISWYDTEPLFLFFSTLCCRLSGGNPYSFFIADSVLMNLILFFTFCYYKDRVSLPILYFMYYFLCFPYFLNVERQGLAVIIVWFAIRYILEKKPVKFSLCIVAATLFHNTAVVGFMLYPAYLIFEKKTWSGLKFMILTVSLLVPVLFGMSLSFLSRYVPVFLKYAKFINAVPDTRINVNWLYAAFMILVLCLFIGVLRRTKMNRCYLYFLFFWQLSSYLLNYYIDWGFRMAFYFEIGLIYSYALVLRNLYNRQNRVLIQGFLIGAMFFHFTYKFYLRGNAEIFPYQTLFSAM